MKEEQLKKRNRTSLLLLALSLVLALLLMSLPLYHFSIGVFTKKSANTVIGDEKYKEVLAEVEAVKASYEEQGLKVELKESVTERTNSKGETTSLVAFSLEQSLDKSILSFLSSTLPTRPVLGLMLLFMGLSLVCALLGSRGSMEVLPRFLSGSQRRLRGLSSLGILGAALLVPVFILLNNYTFWRRLSLYASGQLTEGAQGYYTALTRFLLGDTVAPDALQGVKDIGATHSPLCWALLLCLLVAGLSAISLRHGAIKRSFLRFLLYLTIAAVCVVTIYPYYVMFITAFRSNAETLDMYFLHLLPTRWLWSNLKDIVSRGVLRYLANSFMIAGGATLLAMLCGIPAAYAMARMNFKGKKLFLGFVIMSQMFSPVVLLIGIAQLMNTLHLNDTLWGLIFINAAFNQAFAIWLLRGTFISISPEMEQAAKIDGCNTVGALVRILLPMAMPGIVTTLIFVFINAWNEYTISTVLISTASNRPITVGITQFSSFNMIEWQYLFAASLLATIPVVILFMTIEKHLTSGLTSGGVKG